MPRNLILVSLDTLRFDAPSCATDRHINDEVQKSAEVLRQRGWRTAQNSIITTTIGDVTRWRIL